MREKNKRQLLSYERSQSKTSCIQQRFYHPARGINCAQRGCPAYTVDWEIKRNNRACVRDLREKVSDVYGNTSTTYHSFRDCSRGRERSRSRCCQYICVASYQCVAR